MTRCGAAPGRMRALASVSRRFAREQPLAGETVLLNMHLTPETAQLCAAVAAGGGRAVCVESAGNPSPPEVLRDIAALGVEVRGGIADLGDARPTLVVEGNGRAFDALHGAGSAPAALRQVPGISQHTSGGGRIVDGFAARGGRIRVPVVAVYRTPLKTQLETGLGTGQTAAGALLRGLGAPVAGRLVALVGYGHVGRGVARALSALGAHLTVVEVRAEAALEAAMAGYAVRTLPEALAAAEIVITATGQPGVVAAALLEGARADPVLATLGNRTDEIDTGSCRRLGERGPGHALWRTPGGRSFSVLGAGRQLNHALGTGNPAELMDLSFTLHALVLEWLARDPPPPGLHPPPEALREAAARLCLEGVA